MQFRQYFIALFAVALATPVFPVVAQSDDEVICITPATGPGHPPGTTYYSMKDFEQMIQQLNRPQPAEVLSVDEQVKLATTLADLASYYAGTGKSFGQGKFAILTRPSGEISLLPDVSESTIAGWQRLASPDDSDAFQTFRPASPEVLRTTPDTARLRVIDGSVLAKLGISK